MPYYYKLTVRFDKKVASEEEKKKYSRFASRHLATCFSLNNGTSTIHFTSNRKLSRGDLEKELDLIILQELEEIDIYEGV